MALQPKRVKYRKQHRGRIKGNAQRGNEVSFGEFGLQTLEPGWITGRQIESARIAANQLLKGEGKLWIRIFPHKSVTSTPAETRMGKGKGEIDFWCAVVRPGTVMFECSGVPADAARLALLRATHKLPVRCRFVRRRHKI